MLWRPGPLSDPPSLRCVSKETPSLIAFLAVKGKLSFPKAEITGIHSTYLLACEGARDLRGEGRGIAKKLLGTKSGIRETKLSSWICHFSWMRIWGQFPK